MNQLNAVLNAVELLRQQIGGGEDREALLDAIGQGSLCLARLAVNQADLLSCLRDEGRPNLIAVDLAEQIRTLVEVMRPYVETQHCALVFRRDGPVYLRVEPHMADRVLLNLVAEAVTRYYYDNPDASDRRQPAMDRLDIALSNAEKRTCRTVATQDSKYCARTKYFEVRIYNGRVSADRVKGNNTGDYSIFSYPQFNAQQDVCRGNTSVGSDLCVSLGYTNKKSGTNDYTKK